MFDIDNFCEILGGHPKYKEYRYLAHKIIALISKKIRKKEYNIIIERLFLYQQDINHIKRFFPKEKYAFFMFTLKAPLKELIKRDSKRKGHKFLGKKVIKLLYQRFARSNVKDVGIPINVNNKSIKSIVKEIITHLNK